MHTLFLDPTPMKHALALAILSCLALGGCQRDTPEQSANRVLPARTKHHIPHPAPDLMSGLDAEQQKKMAASLALYADLELGKPIEIVAHTEHKIAGTDLTVEFVQVKRDSRCPPEVQCVWEGEVSVALVAKKNGKEETLELGKMPVDWNGYRLTMQDVLPHPTQPPVAAMPGLVRVVDKAQGAPPAQAVPGAAPTAKLPDPLAATATADPEASTPPPATAQQ